MARRRRRKKSNTNGNKRRRRKGDRMSVDGLSVSEERTEEKKVVHKG